MPVTDFAMAQRVSVVMAPGQYLFSPMGRLPLSWRPHPMRLSSRKREPRRRRGTTLGRISSFPTARGSCPAPRFRAGGRGFCRMTPNNLAVTTTAPDAPGASAVRRRRRVSVEVPTLLVVLVTYGGWLAITFAYGHWPLAIVAPIAAVLITLHGSLQHEIVHEHPTRWDGVNRLIAIVALSLWLPFERYRQSHRAHHIDERITDPLDDPESYYWTPQDWARLKPVTRVIVQLQQTLAGRVTVGAFWAIGRFLRAEARALNRNADGVRAVGLGDPSGVSPV